MLRRNTQLLLPPFAALIFTLATFTPLRAETTNDGVTKLGNWRFKPSIEARAGLQYGESINFGLGALDDIGETERTNLAVSIEPAVNIERDFGAGLVFANLSMVGAANLLEGEISGQFASGGDSRLDHDVAQVGWRNENIEFSVGPQNFVVGDGLVIGDGNFDIGSEQGQFWLGPFNAWKNAVVLKMEQQHLRGDIFWLASDGAFGDARLSGINVENADTEFGRFGVMYINVYAGNALGYDGTEAFNLRALGVPFPGFPALKFFTEAVWQFGEDEDGGFREVDAFGWYLEAAYTLAKLPWTTILTYRYSRFSGDDLSTAKVEEYRSLFYGFYAREWDTFYQGEIAGEYHLFNTNQVTQFLKVRTFPREQFALTIYYYQHDLDTRQYYGTPLSTTDWANEINAGVEYFGEHAYIYAGIAWSTPNQGAKEVFGNDENFTVVQTWMSFHF